MMAGLAASSKENCTLALDVIKSYFENSKENLPEWEKTLNRNDLFPHLAKFGLAYGLIDEAVDLCKRLEKTQLTDEIIELFVKYMASKGSSLPEEEFKMFMDQLQTGNIILSSKYEELFQQIFESNGYTITKTRIKDSGICTACQAKLG